MFATISEAVEAYKAELRRYKEWNDKAMEDSRQHKGVHISADYAHWPHRLEGMQQVLGLTADEIRQINTEVGLVRNKTVTA